MPDPKTGFMTDDEAIAAVQDGKRCRTQHTLLGAESEDSWKCVHSWRTVACNFDRDVIECSKCGRQQTCRCDFDEEYA